MVTIYDTLINLHDLLTLLSSTKGDSTGALTSYCTDFCTELIELRSNCQDLLRRVDAEFQEISQDADYFDEILAVAPQCEVDADLLAQIDRNNKKSHELRICASLLAVLLPVLDAFTRPVEVIKRILAMSGSLDDSLEAVRQFLFDSKLLTLQNVDDIRLISQGDNREKLYEAYSQHNMIPQEALLDVSDDEEEEQQIDGNGKRTVIPKSKYLDPQASKTILEETAETLNKVIQYQPSTNIKALLDQHYAGGDSTAHQDQLIATSSSSLIANLLNREAKRDLTSPSSSLETSTGVEGLLQGSGSNSPTLEDLFQQLIYDSETILDAIQYIFNDQIFKEDFLRSYLASHADVEVELPDGQQLPYSATTDAIIDTVSSFGSAQADLLQPTDDNHLDSLNDDDGIHPHNDKEVVVQPSDDVASYEVPTIEDDEEMDSDERAYRQSLLQTFIRQKRHHYSQGTLELKAQEKEAIEQKKHTGGAVEDLQQPDTKGDDDTQSVIADEDIHQYFERKDHVNLGKYLYDISDDHSSASRTHPSYESRENSPSSSSSSSSSPSVSSKVSAPGSVKSTFTNYSDDEEDVQKHSLQTVAKIQKVDTHLPFHHKGAKEGLFSDSTGADKSKEEDSQVLIEGIPFDQYMNIIKTVGELGLDDNDNDGSATVAAAAGGTVHEANQHGHHSSGKKHTSHHHHGGRHRIQNRQWSVMDESIFAPTSELGKDIPLDVPSVVSLFSIVKRLMVHFYSYHLSNNDDDPQQQQQAAHEKQLPSKQLIHKYQQLLLDNPIRMLEDDNIALRELYRLLDHLITIVLDPRSVKARELTKSPVLPEIAKNHDAHTMSGKRLTFDEGEDDDDDGDHDGGERNEVTTDGTQDVMSFVDIMTAPDLLGDENDHKNDVKTQDVPKVQSYLGWNADHPSDGIRSFIHHQKQHKYHTRQRKPVQLYMAQFEKTVDDFRLFYNNICQTTQDLINRFEEKQLFERSMQAESMNTTNV